MARLLARMERLESQAWALRRVWELLGRPVGDDVPQLYLDRDGSWVVECDVHAVAFVARPFKSSPWISVVVVPDLPADSAKSSTHRTNVLVAILLHLEGVA